MKITDTYLTSEWQERMKRQREIHRYCILLLRETRGKR